MEHPYQLQSPMTHRTPHPINLAPQASMIDPGMQGPQQHNPQLSHGFTFPQRPPNQVVMNSHGNLSMAQGTPDRALPSIEITDESIDQAYLDFIFYCNPSIPLDTDSTELKKGFRSPPMSDGKKFNPFTLFGLISRLESKNIKTWVQLVVELGAEHPDPSKNQSTQKLQQYAVRLKVFSSLNLFSQ